MPEIYSLIGKAMADIGAIGKDDYNAQQKFKFRGIDAVMNALHPVMQKYGLFCSPEVLNQVREERQTTNGGTLKYSILTVKYTMYAPDGSSVSSVVIGEGMDSGDKASNKAMSVAFKYAMFQLFCIPTEDFVDPDSESPVDRGPKKEPPIVTVQSAQDTAAEAKAKFIRALQQNARFAYGTDAEQRLNDLLARNGVTLDTMTGTAYKAINAAITADIAKGSAA